METVSRQTNPLLDPWYVTGFVEGEGSFTYSRNGDSYALYFAVKLTASDEGILIILQQYFGVGKIYNVKAITPRHNSGFTKASRYFRVVKASELVRLVQHFDRYPLRGTKANSYAVWREMVLEKSIPGKASKEKMDRLARLLTQQSPRNQPWHE